MSEKIKYLEGIIEQIKAGKDIEEVKKEFYTKYPEELKANSISDHNIYKDYIEDHNPLVLLAMENSALRALLHSLRQDVNYFDELGKKMIPELLERLNTISIHYKKIEELIVPELVKYDYKETEAIIKEDKRILEVISSYRNKNILEEDRTPLLNLLEDIEQMIVKENHILLPILDERLNEEQLLELYFKECEIGFCLIKR